MSDILIRNADDADLHRIEAPDSRRVSFISYLDSTIALYGGTKPWGR
ncbi:MAG: hypothetical protein U0P48_14015 [Ancrocorticia sp.]